MVSDWADTPFASWSGQAADVVVGSCRLPDVYEAAIAKLCAVFALDYLTAEKYAEEKTGCRARILATDILLSVSGIFR